MNRPRVGVSYRFDARANPVKRRLFRAMEAWADVVRLDAFEAHPDLWRYDLDCLHVARCTPASLADMRRADLAGVRTVNAADGARLACDRLARGRLLRDLGVRVPRFEWGPAGAISLDLPVIAKRRYEFVDADHDHRVIDGGPIDFAGERFVEALVSDGVPYKCYRIGEATCVVSADDEADPRPVDPPPGTVDLVRRVSDALGLALCEVDVLRVERGPPYVVDVNPAVSLRGVPDGGALYESFLREEAARGVSTS
ncbi:hypothetical protein [Halomarina pelagica]|uniref:hypothetical protein n=1 Tax=Halomarina pelagica TaxID=2961599 RepID=UPI0020C40EA5|nr:hypothetical protein [Halomarina sp. BND7]